jgi:tripartite-type tricarboxylate transporter receptor subunit TctC
LPKKEGTQILLLVQRHREDWILDRRRFVAASGVSALSVGLPSTGKANVVDRNARIMVGFPAGSSPDFVARLLAEHVKDYAPSFLVDNRPGAGGRLPLEQLKSGERDGSLMAITPGDQVALFPHVYAKLGYDALRDFAPISTVCVVQFVLVVRPLVPSDVKSVADFVEWCRANPKLANYGSPGEGTRPHFMGASLARSAGLQMTHVPYKGGPPVVQDLLAGQIASSMTVVSNALPNIQSGRLRALAIASAKRSPILPDVPTIREAGYPGAEGVEWFELFVPVGTPDGVVGSLNSAVRKALQSESFRDSLAQQAFEPRGCTPTELAQLVKSDTEQWSRIVRDFGFKPMD